MAEDDGLNDDDWEWDDDGYDDYEPTAVDPGYWMLFTSIMIAAFVMACFMPLLVYWHKQKRHAQKETEKTLKAALLDEGVASGYPLLTKDTNKKIRKVKASFKTITRFDRETKRLLQYALPFTFAAAVSGILGSVVLALIGHFVGTKELAAVVIMDIVLGIMGEFLEGPINANIVLCSQAVGCSNNFLAGQYIQLSLMLYFILQVPLLIVLYFYAYDMILVLGWGDEQVALYAQHYVRIYVWSNIFDTIQEAAGNLLETTGHEIYATVMGIAHDATVVLIIVFLITIDISLSIEIIAWICVANSIFFLLLSTGIAAKKGWFKPFAKGMLRNCALKVCCGRDSGFSVVFAA